MYIINNVKTIENLLRGYSRVLPENGIAMKGFATQVLYDVNGKIKVRQKTDNIETTLGKQKLAAYISASSEAAAFMPYQEVGTKGTTTSTTISANSVTAGVTITVGTDIASAGAAVIKIIGTGGTDTVGIQTGHSTTYTFPTTTVAAGSNGVVLGTNGTLNVASTSNFIDPVTTGLGIAYIQVVIGGTAQVCSYTAITSTTFTGLQLVGAAAGTLATSQVVNQNPQNSYSGVTTVTLAPQKGDTTNGTALSTRISGTVTNPGAPSNIYQNAATFSGAGYVGSITEAGLFDASTSGNMFAHQTFGLITYSSGDTLTNTWQVTFS